MNKKSKLIFFVFSLIPGAAHMYIGLTKRGLMLMSVFALCMGLSAAFSPVFLCLLPLLWFYCFFDSWNKYALPLQDLAKVKDDFFFFCYAMPEVFAPQDANSNNIRKNVMKAAGAGAVFLGAYLLWNNVVMRIFSLLPDNSIVLTVISTAVSLVPQLTIAAILIFIGVKLITHKKKELENNGEHDIDIDSGRDDLPTEK